MIRLSKLKTSVLAAGMAAAIAPLSAMASSHREAPLIGEDPAADNTDLYAFVSPDDPNSVTIIAGYIPLEEPGGGPNWQRFSENVLYSIYIDNTGDGQPDITYQFTFETWYNSVLASGNAGTFFYNVGQIDGLPTPANFHNAAVAQTMSVTRLDGTTRTPLAYRVPTAPIYVGRFAYGTGGTPAADDATYTTISQSAVQTLPSGEHVFAGQRDDPFFVDLGAVFDDVTIRNGLGNMGGGVDYVGGYNVHAIAIQVPISRLVQAGTPTTATDPRNVIGIYAAASRQRVGVLRHCAPPSPTMPIQSRFGRRPPMGITAGVTPSAMATLSCIEEPHGQFVQVSRLGIPLVNEVLIPLTQKDYWNEQDPWNDAANFGSFLLVPSLPTYAQALYGPSGLRAHLGYVAPTRSATDPTNDMLQLVTGRVGITGTPAAGFTPADVLRLNVRTAPSALPTNTGNPTLASGLSRLGAAGGDTNGFPNGRRLFDDVVDIEERYVLNGLAHLNAIPFGDGVDGNDVVYQTTFPYVPIPHPGSIPGVHPTQATHP